MQFSKFIFIKEEKEEFKKNFSIAQVEYLK